MPEAHAVTVRFRLKELLEEREKKGDAISQSELARKSGVSIVTVNAIVNNRTEQVRLDTLDALCKALGVEPGELLQRERGRR
jgi:putative transcriptional regulator